MHHEERGFHFALLCKTTAAQHVAQFPDGLFRPVVMDSCGAPIVSKPCVTIIRIFDLPICIRL